jgi:hypothetical protein
MLAKPGVLFYIIYPVSVSLALVGLWVAQKEILIAVFLLHSIIRALFRKTAESFFLVVSIGFAVLGLLQDVEPVFMYLYAASSLICFDVTEMEIRTGETDESAALAHYRVIRFYPMIGVTLGTVSFIVVLSYVTITMPFFLLLILTTTGFFLINRFIHFLRQW